MDLDLQIKAHEKHLVLEALSTEEWSRSAAAERLGIPIRRLYRLVHRHGLKSHARWEIVKEDVQNHKKIEVKRKKKK